jgi:hypothetical protein
MAWSLVTRRWTTSGYGQRSCFTALTRWLNTRRVQPLAAGAAVPAPPAHVPAPAPLQLQVGFRQALAVELRAGAALVGAQVLYLWPMDHEGWGRARVRRVCRQAGFSHMVNGGLRSVVGAWRAGHRHASRHCVAQAGRTLIPLGAGWPSAAASDCWGRVRGRACARAIRQRLWTSGSTSSL